MADNLDPTACLLLVAVVLPIWLAVIRSYQAPPSFRDSLRRAPGATLIPLGSWFGGNIGRAGLNLERWNWAGLWIVPIVFVAILVVDEAKRRYSAERAAV